MEEQLKGLRKSMEKTTFKQLRFSEHHRKQVYEKINKKPESNEDLYVAVLQLLYHQKTGYELTRLLRARGIQHFENNEGFLYILLHQLEQNGLIISIQNEEGDKFYQVRNKGRKVLRKAEKGSPEKPFSLYELGQE